MDDVTAYRLWKETRATVSRLHRAAERGESVSEAINFCRYLQWSGVLGLLKLHASACVHLPVDGALLEWEVAELLQFALAVPETKRLGTFEQRTLSLLDVIAGHVAKIGPPGVPQAVRAVQTPGGAQ